MAAGLGVQFLTSACRTSRMFCTVVPGFRWGTTFGGALKHHIDESEGWTRPGVIRSSLGLLSSGRGPYDAFPLDKYPQSPVLRTANVSD